MTSGTATRASSRGSPAIIGRLEPDSEEHDRQHTQRREPGKHRSDRCLYVCWPMRETSTCGSGRQRPSARRRPAERSGRHPGRRHRRRPGKDDEIERREHRSCEKADNGHLDSRGHVSLRKASPRDRHTRSREQAHEQHADEESRVVLKKAQASTQASSGKATKFSTIAMPTALPSLRLNAWRA